LLIAETNGKGKQTCFSIFFLTYIVSPVALRNSHDFPHLCGRVARFFLVHDTKTVKNVSGEHKIYQRVIKYPHKLSVKYSRWP
jgi:hypothetical protein